MHRSDRPHPWWEFNHYKSSTQSRSSRLASFSATAAVLNPLPRPVPDDSLGIVHHSAPLVADNPANHLIQTSPARPPLKAVLSALPQKPAVARVSKNRLSHQWLSVTLVALVCRELGLLCARLRVAEEAAGQGGSQPWIAETEQMPGLRPEARSIASAPWSRVVKADKPGRRHLSR